MDCKLLEPRQAILHNISGPASPDCCQPCAMGYIIKPAHFMLQHMGGEIPAVIPAACKPIVRKASCPHDFSPRIIIFRIVFQDSGIADYGTHQCFRNTVCNLHIAAIGKIALHGVHQNICAAAGSLVIRQCHSKLRIHDGKTGPG